MSPNTKRRIPWLSFVCAAVMAFILIATISTPTSAQNAENSISPKWFSRFKLKPDFGYVKNDGKQSFNLKGKTVAVEPELQMVALVNQERVETGLTKLEIDNTLVRLAEEKARDMVRFNYFGHHSERLGTIYDQLERAHFQYRFAAENLIGAPDYRRAEQCAVSSPAHRGNILNPHFRRVGIGIVRGGPYGEMIVQIFSD